MSLHNAWWCTVIEMQRYTKCKQSCWPSNCTRFHSNHVVGKRRFDNSIPYLRKEKVKSVSYLGNCRSTEQWEIDKSYEQSEHYPGRCLCDWLDQRTRSFFLPHGWEERFPIRSNEKQLFNNVRRRNWIRMTLYVLKLNHSLSRISSVEFVEGDGRLQVVWSVHRTIVTNYVYSPEHNEQDNITEHR